MRIWRPHRKTAVIVLCEEAVLIWAIPPLLPQPPDFFDDNPTHIPPLFTIPFPSPDGIVLHHKLELFRWKTTSSWYFGSSQPLYFDMLCHDSMLYTFKLIVKPDLSDASLRVINTSGPTPYNVFDRCFESYRICEDNLVSWWIDCYLDGNRCLVCTGLLSAAARFAIVSRGGPISRMLLTDFVQYTYNLFPCPATGRFVYLDSSNRLRVLDFL